MKDLSCLLICLTAFTAIPAFGQQAGAPPAAEQTKNAKLPPPEPPPLTRFDLDFPGGTPKELVAAIQKGMGRPLNAIVADEFIGVKLPPLKMSGVSVYQL